MVDYQLIFEDFLKLLSTILTWPFLIIMFLIIYRSQIGKIIPGLANRITSISLGEAKVELGAIKDVKDAIESDPNRFSETDRQNSAALISSAETGDIFEKSYALEALKDVAVSLPGSKQEIAQLSEQEINQLSLEAYLLKAFPDRIHAESKYVSEMVNELIKEDCRYIKDVHALIERYPLEKYIIPMDAEIGVKSADVGVIRSLLVAKKIDEINSVIESWKSSLAELPDLRDEKPFVDIGSGIASYLIKSGDSIKIYATNVGELEISYKELGNRIGTGLPYLRRLKDRLGPFHEYLASRA